MAQLVILVSSALALVAMMAASGSAESHHELCLGKRVNFTSIEFTALGECVKEFAPPPTLADGVTESSEDISARISKARSNKCMEACFMNHKKMFDNGKFDMTKSLVFIDEFPEEVRKDLTDSLKKCAATVEGKTLKMDNDCKEYEEFIKCVDDDENKICKREE